MFLLAFSTSVFAIKPANIVVLVDLKETNQQQAVNMLYSQTWELLEGEFDVRFSTPRISKVDEVFSDEDVDLVVTLGKQGASAIQQRNPVEKPTIIVEQTMGLKHSGADDNVMGIAKQKKESSETFIHRVGVALRDKLRNK